MRRVRLALFVATAFVFYFPQVAGAKDVSGGSDGLKQSLALYTGGSFTHSTTLHLHQEGEEDVTLRGVVFANKPFVPPPFYGVRYRLEWPGASHVFDAIGIEAEVMHYKIYFDHADDPDGIVQRFDSTDGLNFVMLNAVGAKDIIPPWRLELRAGLGPVIAHPETEIRHRDHGRNGDPLGYTYAGMGGQAAVGLSRTLTERSRLFVEYAYTLANPKIEIAGGYGTTRIRAHHVLVGWATEL